MLKEIKAQKGFLKTGEISQSQLGCSKKEYISKYIIGNDFSNKYTEFGKKIHSQVENSIKQKKYTLNLPLSFIEKISGEDLKAEFELKGKEKIIIDTKYKFHGFCDVLDTKNHIIYDIKCVKEKNMYDISKMEKLTQVHLYCLMYKEVYGVSPTKFVLENVIYEELEDGTLELTSEVVKVEWDISEEDILDMEENIDNKLQSFISMVNSITDEDVKEVEEDGINTLPDEYEEILNEIINIKNEIDLFEKSLDEKKKEVEIFLELEQFKKFKNQHTTIYSTSKSEWEFNKTIRDMETDLKVAKDKFKEKNKPIQIKNSWNWKIK